MSQDRTFSDEELVAYLDGEVEHCPAPEIEQALITDALLASRLASLHVDTDAIRESFDALQLNDVQMPELSPPIVKLPAKRSLFRFMPSLVAASVALCIGFGAGYYSTKSSEPGWKAYVAAYQALYANSTLAHVKSDPIEMASELKRVSSAIGKDIDIASLTTVAGLEFKRSQVLSFKGRPLIQLAFLSSTGEPVALCIVRTKKPNSTSISKIQLEGMRAASWSKNGYDYLLIGGQDETLISSLANQYAGTI